MEQGEIKVGAETRKGRSVSAEGETVRDGVGRCDVRGTDDK